MAKRRYLAQVKVEPDAVTFKKWVESNSGSWWHWIPHSWLLVFDENSSVTTSDIRDQLRDLTGREWVMVTQVETKAWYGFGPNNDEKNMFNWIKKNWLD